MRNGTEYFHPPPGLGQVTNAGISSGGSQLCPRVCAQGAVPDSTSVVPSLIKNTSPLLTLQQSHLLTN